MLHTFTDGIAVVTRICQEVIEGFPVLVEQAEGLYAFGLLPGGGDESKRVAQRVAQPVKLGREAASGAAQSLIVLIATLATGVLMSTHDRAIGHDILGVGLFAQFGQNLLPQTTESPAPKASIDA